MDLNEMFGDSNSTATENGAATSSPPADESDQSSTAQSDHEVYG